MKKLPNKYENIFDIFIYKIVKKLVPYFRKWNFTPNQITTIGNIFGFMGIYKLYKGKYIESAIFYFIRYIFDCLDGYYARKYNEITIFGDWYDHISDILIFLIYLILLFLKNKKLFFKFSILLIIILYLMFIHFYYQELYYNNDDESPTLDYIKKLVPKNLIPKNKQDLENKLLMTKYFGNGIMILLIILVLISYEYSS